MINNYEYLVNNHEKLNTGLTKDQFIELLNILESNGKDYDSFSNAILNRERMFCDLWHDGAWATPKDLYQTLVEFHTFIKKADFKQFLADRMEDFLDDSETIEDIKMYFNWELDDIKDTTDGYVKRYNY